MAALNPEDPRTTFGLSSALLSKAARCRAVRLNLRRKPRTWALFGALTSLVAILMLAVPDKSLEQTIFGFLLLVGGFSAVVYIDRIAVETGSCELVRQRGLIVSLYRQRYARDRISAVTLRKKVVRKGKEITTFPIHLKGIKGAVVPCGTSRK